MPGDFLGKFQLLVKLPNKLAYKWQRECKWIHKEIVWAYAISTEIADNFLKKLLKLLVFLIRLLKYSVLVDTSWNGNENTASCISDSLLRLLSDIPLPLFSYFFHTYCMTRYTSRGSQTFKYRDAFWIILKCYGSKFVDTHLYVNIFCRERFLNRFLYNWVDRRMEYWSSLWHKNIPGTIYLSGKIH